MEQRWRTIGVMVAGACVAVGVAAGGWLVGKGMHRFRAEVRTVSVKGLVEREVASDSATWKLVHHRAAETLADAHAGLRADRKAIVAFLHERGFSDAEIEIRPTRTYDKLAQENAEPKKVQLRYVVTSAIVVSSQDVKRVIEATGATEKLLGAGVILDFNGEGRANPRYTVSKFNDLRPVLLAEATKNARAIAQQFAADSGATVGKIQSANQGHIQIFGSDGNDESGYYSPTSTPMKKIRVVSSFDFELN